MTTHICRHCKEPFEIKHCQGRKWTCDKPECQVIEKKRQAQVVQKAVARWKAKKIKEKQKGKKVICLRCDKPFIPNGKWNRICPTCTLLNRRSECYHVDQESYGRLVL